MKAESLLAKEYSSELENEILNLHPIYPFPKPPLHSEDGTLPHPYKYLYLDLSTPATDTPSPEELPSPQILPSTAAQNQVIQNAEKTTSSFALAQHLKPTPGSPPPPRNTFPKPLSTAHFVETKSRSTLKAPQQVKFPLDHRDHNHAKFGSPSPRRRPRAWYRWNRILNQNTPYHVPASIQHIEVLRNLPSWPAKQFSLASSVDLRTFVPNARALALHKQRSISKLQELT